MAAVRRLGVIFRSLSLSSAPRNALYRSPVKDNRCRRRGIAVAVCVAAGGAVLYYYYSETCGFKRRKVPINGIGCRALLPSLPAVAAKDKAPPFDFDESDVYMSSHEHHFRLFSSVEYEGQLYMTPQNFIESVTMSEPRMKKPWRSLTKQELEKILSDTPPVWKGTSKLFRNLQERGTSQAPVKHKPEAFTSCIIAYTEYLFLLCILTKPHAGFKIAFNMFDADGNQMVDKGEFLVLQEIFRTKNEKKGRKGDAEKSAQLSMQLYGYQIVPVNNVLKKESQEFVPRSYWDMLRRGASQALFSDLAEDLKLKHANENMMIDSTLLVHFFGKKGKAELTFEDFYRFMDNLQTEMLEIEFLTYSKGMTTISEEDFARILLRYTNVEDIRSYLENVRQCIPDEKGITFDEFRSFFQFLNNLEDFAIAMQMYNFACRSIGQDEFGRAVYVATGLKLTHHLVNTIFRIFDVDHDDQLSYKEFIGIMKDRLHRGGRGYKAVEHFTSFKSCLKKELAGSR
ncbi:calcium uptake protein 3, mitochondrial-like isoform X2 [Cyprinus carpio]|uniref:Calcium uptake protein 3, mitochondrial-like isoform X2 n=1 Tax=Cyprinus carpio TaxID=7962 RepID=A0A9Q9W1W5_CYPCA|nr:calcium uptake protein 3, mitochondrial-like isoform X2 [Cyprinus carpio]